MTSQVSRTDWPGVLLAVGAGVVGAFQVGKAPIALPQIRAELGLDLSQAAWILSLLPLTGALTGALLGGLVTRLGPRRVLPAALLLIAAASLGGGLAPGAAALLASRVIEGFGFMLVIIAAPALVTLATHPHDRPLAFGLWGCFMPFGMAVAMLAAPLLPAIGWRGLWLAMAALLTLAALLAWRRLPAAPAPAGLAAAATPARLLHDLAHTLAAPGPRLLAPLFLCYSVCYIGLTGFLPTLLIERMAISPGAAGLLTALVAAANMVGNLAASPLLRRGVPAWRPILAGALTIAATASLIYLPATPAPLAYALALLFSAVGGLLPACLFAAAAAHAPTPRLVPVALGLLMQGSTIGQVLGPILVGTVATAWGWSAVAPLLAGVILTAAALALALRRLPPPA
ncbi:MAG: hypothetical protein RLZZ501_2542 [Pseudomonadota bacterium]|jgi:MFS family permease